MRKYFLYAAVLCSAAVLGLSGCSNKADAATTLPMVNESRTVVVESLEPTSSAEETTVVETVSGTIESAEEQLQQSEEALRLYGPATHMEDGRLSIDSQSGQGYQGEVILNVSQESTYVLDAVSGMPVELSDIKDGDTIHLDVMNGVLELTDVSDAELAERRKSWKRPHKDIPNGYLRLYSKVASSAAKGAVIDPEQIYSKAEQD